jgi:hypothetical protein
VAEVVEHLPSKHETLSSNSSITKKKKKKERKKKKMLGVFTSKKMNIDRQLLVSAIIFISF